MKKIEVVAAIIYDGSRFFATQRGYGEFKGLWEFPGGKIEKGETQEEALKREIKEELNVDIDIDKFLCTVEYDYPTFHLTMHCHICHIACGNIILTEHLDARWLDKDKLNEVNWLPADILVVDKVKSLFTIIPHQ